MNSLRLVLITIGVATLTAAWVIVVIRMLVP